MMTQEDIFTSTGAKYLMHPEQIMAYRKAPGCSIISTHISPEGRCNLDCAYCSVRNRDASERIELPVIEDYVLKLVDRGLKAVIISGGGEPALYPKINELIEWLAEQGLSIGMITNGTLTDRVHCWHLLTWVRISVNMRDGWLSQIEFPGERDGCTLGLSYIHAGGNPSAMYKLTQLAAKLDAEYIRLTVDCLAGADEMKRLHGECETVVAISGDRRFFHQNKRGRRPNCDACHQSYFRPYLSEMGGGTVFPCGSLVLNNQMAAFGPKFAICPSGDILDFLDGKIKPKFTPREDCDNCVFASTVEMLGALKEGIRHAEFV